MTGCPLDKFEVVRPAELTGKWVKLRTDGTWGDTVEYLADGRVVAGLGTVLRRGARWSVVRSRSAGQALCTSDSASTTRSVSCPQLLRIEGDTILVGVSTSPSYFRRVR